MLTENQGDTITYVLSEPTIGPPALRSDPSPATGLIGISTNALSVVPRLSNLFIRDINGRNHTLHNIPLDMTVRQLLVKWQERNSVDIDGMRLIYGMKQLDPDRRGEFPLLVLVEGRNGRIGGKERGKRAEVRNWVGANGTFRRHTHGL